MDCEKIRQNGWRQGHFLSEDHADILVESEGLSFPEGARLAVLSQSCDVVSKDPLGEPVVELGAFVLADPGDSCNGQRVNGKNPRYLRVNVQSADDISVFEIHAANRMFVSRSVLEQACPDTGLILVDREFDILRNWLAGRYRRAALPDNFNTRVRPVWNGRAGKRQKKSLEGVSKNLTMVYVGLNTFDELGEGQDYEVLLMGMMPSDLYQDVETRNSVAEVINGLFAALNECDGVSVVEYHVRSESDVTFEELSYLVALDLESMSFREDPPDPHPNP